MRVVFSTAARADLREIAAFIAADNRRHAANFIAALRLAAEQLGRMPYAYPLFQRPAQGDIRRRTFRNYVILYRVSDGRVAIVRIVHGARDLEALPL